tara:strand:+ start:176 stop:562 length:387 start_codon:yes stop_codon:yes gene_type:complete
MNANNNVILMGRLTADPEVKETKDGTKVASFSIAVQRNKEVTDFFDCSAWRHTAEFIGEWFGKGKMILVVGELRQDRWQTGEGANRSKVKVEVTSATFAGDKSADDAAPASTKPKKQAVEVSEDDIPF